MKSVRELLTSFRYLFVVLVAVIAVVQLLRVSGANIYLPAAVGIADPEPASYWEAGRDGRPKPFFLSGTSQWLAFKKSVLSDRSVLDRVERETGIRARLIVSELVAEQMRYHFSSKGRFERLTGVKNVLMNPKIGISLGPMGLKVSTAKKIESHALNESTPFYPGPGLVRLISTTGAVNSEEELFLRFTAVDHYYSYLYAAMYSREIIAQWNRYGYDISERPEIIATLYNIGFSNSRPNSEPKVGGAAVVSFDGRRYSFGRLAYEFYYSSELLEEFQR